jgi:DNA-binding transcriptional ArsR family regulator
MDEKHILVSLGDERVKEISEVIGSKSCNKILDLLAEEELSVSEISRRLNLPMNTVDYNVKKLLKSGLIDSSSSWWSVKGKRMPSYKISNRKIIISPKKSIAGKFLWVLGITGLAALSIREFVPKESAVEHVARDVFALSPNIESIALDSGFVPASSYWASLNPWSWFLIGAWFAVFLFFAFALYSERRRR